MTSCHFKNQHIISIAPSKDACRHHYFLRCFAFDINSVLSFLIGSGVGRGKNYGVEMLANTNGTTRLPTFLMFYVCFTLLLFVMKLKDVPANIPGMVEKANLHRKKMASRSNQNIRSLSLDFPLDTRDPHHFINRS